jgi:hypothetical protein
MLALGLATVALAQVRDPRLSDSQEPGSVIVFPKFIRGTVPVGDVTTPRTEIEVGVVCPRGATCPEGQVVKIRFHWVCGADQTFERKFICPEVNFDARVTVNGKLVFSPDSVGGNFRPPPPVGPENLSQPQTGRLAPVSSRGSPLIVMMQPAHFWDFPDHPKLRPLDRPRHRTIHF